MAALVSYSKHQNLELLFEKFGKFVPNQDFHWMQIQAKNIGIFEHTHTNSTISDKGGLNAPENSKNEFQNGDYYFQAFLEELDSIKVLQSIGAFENSENSGKSFREAFEQLNQSIAKRNEKDAKEYGNRCIHIAIDNSVRNPFWVGQLIAVYTVIANEQIIYKNFKKAIYYATKAVDAAEQSDLLIGEKDNYHKFLAQSLMLRGILFSTQQVWDNAIDDFSQAAKSYCIAKDFIQAIEAYRMSAHGFQQLGDNNGIRRQLMPALNLGKELPTEIIRSTTFAGVLKMLLDLDDLQWIREKEIEAVGLLHYGEDWVMEIRNWKNPETLAFVG